MANFHRVNQKVKKAFPNLNIEVVRGEGYVYFSGDFAYEHHLESIMTHPVSTPTPTLIKMCMEEIYEVLES